STDRFSDFFYRVRAESPLHHQFLNRWLRTLSEPLPEIPIAAMDIEVRCPSVGHIPDPREADEPVICVCFVCSDGRKCAFLLLRSEVGDQVPEVAGVEVFAYRDERELLKAVFEFIIKYPVLVTFNGDDFDLRYLWHRAVDRFGFRREETPFEAHHDWMGVRHGIHIDLYPFFDNRSIQNYAYEQRYRETTLDDLAQALLNKRKIELEKPIGELDYKTLIEYCMNDAQLTYELAIKLRALELLFLISRIVITPPENVCRTGISIWIKNLLYASMRRLHPRYLIPHPEEVRKRGTITTRPVIKDKLYRGGFVKEPVPGVHFDVVVLDFASLYPSVISVWNISFDTVLCPHSECRDNLIPGTPHHVCRKRTGIVSAVIGSLKDVRVEYFKKLAKDKRLSPEERAFYNSVQLTMKVILNASYGVFGLRAFPLFCPPVAEGTAAVGRYALTKTIEKAESLGVRVLYGDTDSVFLHRPTEEQIHELIKWSERELKLKLELDKRYRYVVLPALKKNYIGVYDDGTVEVKGLAGKKRHMPAFIKRVFVEALETLSKVKTPEDFVDARNHIIHIVSEAHRKLRRREFDVRDLALVVKLGKDISEYRKTTPQHVKAARMLERLGRKVRRGDLIAFVKTRRGGAMPIDLARPEDVDIDKYAELLENTFRPILAALDLEVAEVTGGKMRSLFEFS
ncbi:DNA-directed DNA polymerase I, partial [archaeon]|nr:DNA-directed DNA polymerase I [archaeon]